MKTEIKERPILFSAPMVRAILDGRKTQTRRVVSLDKAYHDCGRHEILEWRQQNGKWFGLYEWNTVASLACPFGSVGDQLWVRETCKAEELPSGLDGVRYAADSSFREIENSQAASHKWSELRDYGKGRGKNVPSIHMPRWASRINLEVTGVRVERLNEISERDATDEGMHKFASLELWGSDPKGTPGPMVGGSAVEAFALLWESLNGDGSWNANPWVWAISFKRI